MSIQIKHGLRFAHIDESKLESERLKYPSDTKLDLRLLQDRIDRLQYLTTIVRAELPEDHAWQVASLSDHLLCIAAQNHAQASKIRYMQKQLIQKLNQKREFANVTDIKVIVVQPLKPNIMTHERLPKLTHNTKLHLNEIAKHFLDPKISEVLLRLASIK